MHNQNIKLLLLSLGFLTAACASSHEKKSIPEEYANLVELTPVSGQEVIKSNVYIDSAQVIEEEDRLSLLILGTFPDGCTNIGRAEHQIHNDRISLSLEAWRQPDQMCTQALVTFSFLYRQVPEESLREAETVTVNETDFPINQ
ncbi:hypothetical protein NC796_23360 [Aliifodinibius sp. S!AR15-10]|uniref:hypothetical protein n=1 Tax=Aliifodinibius sp. S!AR15-10 TaxID=2950437 RepID=UPI0028547719|nr:hypothetical protein [Aliifodinibius sp. S!AR15-10]MDR8394106.1 hypothetical protein [Aliifodinibius sp. S!AR15-10]